MGQKDVQKVIIVFNDLESHACESIRSLPHVPRDKKRQQGRVRSGQLPRIHNFKLVKTPLRKPPLSNPVKRDGKRNVCD